MVSSIAIYQSQFDISHLCVHCSMLPTDRTLTGATTPGQSAPGSNGNEGVLRILRNVAIRFLRVISWTLILPLCRDAASLFNSLQPTQPAALDIYFEWENWNHTIFFFFECCIHTLQLWISPVKKKQKNLLRINEFDLNLVKEKKNSIHINFNRGEIFTKWFQISVRKKGSVFYPFLFIHFIPLVLNITFFFSLRLVFIYFYSLFSSCYSKDLKGRRD